MPESKKKFTLIEIYKFLCLNLIKYLHLLFNLNCKESIFKYENHVFSESEVAKIVANLFSNGWANVQLSVFEDQIVTLKRISL